MSKIQTTPPETAKMGSAQEPLLPAPGAPGTPAAYPDQRGSAATPSTKHFDTGICECCAGPDGCVICLVSDCLPCAGHALVADAASQHKSGKLMPLLLYTLGNSFVPCATAIVLGTLARGKLRQTYGMEPNTCGDACAHICCHCCAQAQELRAVRKVEGSMTGVTNPAAHPDGVFACYL